MPKLFATGGYSQPIILPLTPWTQTTIEVGGDRSTWPPNVDADRLGAYDDLEALVENRPESVFDDLQLRQDQKDKIVVAAALPELLCNVWADAVWNDPPELELPDSSLTAWQAIDEANDFTEIRAWESVFGCAMRGTSVLRMFRSKELADLTGHEVQVEEITPAIFFPKLRAGSDRLIEYVVLAWEEDRSDFEDEKQDVWQVREWHRLAPENRGLYTITRQERKPGGFNSDAFRRAAPDEIADGVDFLPFVDMHAKRWSGRYWGLSELARNLSIFDEIDNSLSNIAEVLEYHGKPMLQVPASTIYGGVFSKGADRAIGIRNPEEANVARYITFDGKIADALASIDKNLELAFLTSEVPRTYFGFTDGGAPSGTSLRAMMQNYLKKASRWQRNEANRLKKVVDMALRLDGITDEKARLAKVNMGSPLPADDESEARIETALYTAKLASRRGAMLRLRRAGGKDEVDEEIAEIESEAEEAAALAPPLPQLAGDPTQDPTGAPPEAPEPPPFGRKLGA